MTITHDKLAIIGAGPVGLAVARALKARGLAYQQFDADDGIGGNWRHGVYQTTHIISSRKTTEYSDYPMPESYPDFPSAAQMLAYLEDYAEHFGLNEHIELRRKITFIRPVEDERWEVSFEGGERRVFKGVLVCNGHHWDRRWPDYPGTFAGEMIHSKDYKRPDQLAGKRVLVIGGGNSACDVASEAARVGASAHISQRRGYWLLPKTMFGMPTAELPMRHMPLGAQRRVLELLLRVVVGRYEDYGLEAPDHRLFERHPTVNSELLHYLKHGRVVAHPDVRRFDGRTVHFTDGAQVEVDMVVCATGFHVSFPFLPKGLVQVKGAVPQVYGGSMVRGFKHLYMVGWAQPRYGFGPLVTPAAQLLAEMIELQDGCENPLADVLHFAGDRPPSTHLMDPIKTLSKMKRGRRWLRFLPRLDRRLTARSGRAASPAVAMVPTAEVDAVF